MPKVNNNGNEIILAKFRFKLRVSIKNVVKINAHNKELKQRTTNFKFLKTINKKVNKKTAEIVNAIRKELTTTWPALYCITGIPVAFGK